MDVPQHAYGGISWAIYSLSLRLRRRVVEMNVIAMYILKYLSLC